MGFRWKVNEDDAGTHLVIDFAPVCCMPWHARGSEDEPVHGGECRYCHREIAVPASAKGVPVACIYCGMERGFVEAKEIEPY
jgi:hypothetical protein